MTALLPSRAAPMWQAGSDVLARLHLLDGSWEPAYDRLTALACDVLSAPSAAVSIIDDGGDRQYFKSFHKLDDALAEQRQTPLSQSLCSIVRDSGAPLTINDAGKDARFQRHPAYVDLGIQAYLGQPIHLPCGTPVGALCVLDSRARVWTDSDKSRLAALAGCVDDAIRRVAAAEDAIEGQRKAGRAIAARTLFLAGLNHEVRTALNGVLGTAEALVDLSFDDEARLLVEELLRSGDDLHGLLETLMDRTDAMTADRQGPRHQDLKDILATVLGVLRLAPPGRAHSFTSEVSEGGGPVGNPFASRFKQMLYDLLGNAVSASPTGATDIRVSDASGKEVILCVTLDADPADDTDLEAILADLDFDPVRRAIRDAGGAFHIRPESPMRVVFEACLPIDQPRGA